jgi:hypothetical protein
MEKLKVFTLNSTGTEAANGGDFGYWFASFGKAFRSLRCATVGIEAAVEIEIDAAPGVPEVVNRLSIKPKNAELGGGPAQPGLATQGETLEDQQENLSGYLKVARELGLGLAFERRETL